MLDINSLLGWQGKTPQRSCLRLQGTTNASPNQCKTWGTIIQRVGNEIVYEKDTVLGDRIRVVSDGLYYISYTDSLGAAGYIGISLNADPSTGVSSLPQDQILGMVYEGAANELRSVSALVVLKARDIVRAHGAGAVGSGGNANGQIFIMTKVGEF